MSLRPPAPQRRRRDPSANRLAAFVPGLWAWQRPARATVLHLLSGLMALYNPLASASQGPEPTPLVESAAAAVASPAPAQVATDSPSDSPGQTAKPPAFSLQIEAPEALRSLLARHLELQRYQSLEDLDEPEMRRLVQDAQTQARELLATQGHFAPLLDMLLTPTGERAPAWAVVLKAEPGPRAVIGQVDLQLEGAMAADPQAERRRQRWLRQWLLPAGKPFTQAAWDRAKAEALRQLVTEDYPQARLRESQARVDPHRHTVDLQLRFDSGPAVRIGPLEITGAERYAPEQVQRLAQLREGSRYRQAELLEAQQRLVASGYYDAVFVSLAPEGPPQAHPVRIELREALRQKWVLGLGVRSETGPRLSVEYVHHRVPRLDWRASLKAALERDHQLTSLELLAPPEEDLWRRTGALQFERTAYDAYTLSTQRLRAGRVQLSEPLDRAWYAQLDTAQRRGAIEDSDRSLSLHTSLTRRRFANLPFPDRGWGLGLELGAGVSLGEQPQVYGRWLSRLLFIEPVALGRSRLALRAELGGVITRRTDDLPSSQLFLAGGEQSVRGYAPGSIGVPKDDGVVVAGRYLATGSVEWQVPIRRSSGPSGWEAVLFADAGAVANRPGALRAQTAVGAGARWRSPVGPLQIDLARALEAQRWRLHLSVGFRF